jgi:hypothetical protein
VLFASLANCGGKGPKVTGCVVDSKNSGFQCVKYPKERFFLPFEKGEYLQCVSGTDLELGLKACKEHEPIPPLTLCSLDYVRNKFFCQLQTASAGYYIDVEKADNYFCLSEQDRRRILERCKSTG